MLVRSPVPVSDYPTVFLVRAPTGSVLRGTASEGMCLVSPEIQTFVLLLLVKP